MWIIIYMKITPVFFGDGLLLQVVVLVDTTNFWSYEDTSCAKFCSNIQRPKYVVPLSH